ncbi:hypothetical protein B0J11DRAFT_564252 [Dendryphion nanum]|uniref:Uncharacterized protein n=1 Tax=Dendryphion nanum TaxID=256645 RepID=A0A9P9IZD4_9PLEO|nr:hypothetical protein B0J11DRAFT_564252 [Dendryphion nanum]
MAQNDYGLVVSSRPPKTAMHCDRYAGRQLPDSWHRGSITTRRYGSTPEFNLCLCHFTFATPYQCGLGSDCIWRHSPLTDKEHEWIVRLGYEEFSERCKENWSTPRVPEPTLPHLSLEGLERSEHSSQGLSQRESRSQKRRRLRKAQRKRKQERSRHWSPSLASQSYETSPCSREHNRRTTSPQFHSSTPSHQRHRHPQISRSRSPYRHRRSPECPAPNHFHSKDEDNRCDSHEQERRPEQLPHEISQEQIGSPCPRQISLSAYICKSKAREIEKHDHSKFKNSKRHNRAQKRRLKALENKRPLGQGSRLSPIQLSLSEISDSSEDDKRGDGKWAEREWVDEEGEDE